MPRTVYRALIVAVGVTAMVAVAGCSNYVKKDQYQSKISELESNQQDLQQQVDSLSQEMHQRFKEYDTRISAMEGRIRVDTIAHFAFDESTLQSRDKAALDDFADVMQKHHSNAMVTVEGFADPAGSSAYNKQLGERRAQAVRDYLVEAGMDGNRLRTVSYGDNANRQVDQGATGDQGQPNRRASLVVDFAGNS